MYSKANWILGFIAFFLSLALYGQGQYLSGQSGLENFLDEDLKEIEADNTFIFSPGEELPEIDTSKIKKRSVHLSEEDYNDEAGKGVSQKGGIDPKAYVPSSLDDRPEYLEYEASDIRRGYAKKGTKAISFIYFPTSFEDVEYENNRNTFNEVFINGAESKRSGTLILSSEYLFLRKIIDIGAVFNLGVAYNTGNAYFVSDNTTPSSTNLKLWMIPVDLGLSIGIPIGQMFKIGIVGGVSAMGLFQNRSDFDSGERGKRRRQAGYGYFGGARIKFDLTRWSRWGGIDMYDHSSVTKLYLTVEGRQHTYSNFQDEIEISGSLFGIGVTFEYL